MPSVNMTLFPTPQPIHSDSTILSSLSSYAIPLLLPDPPHTINHNRRRSQQTKKKSIIVSLRNWNGEEITDVIWPISFVPFPPSLSLNEQTLSTHNLTTLYDHCQLSDDDTAIFKTSFLILPNKNYSSLPPHGGFDEHEVQRILHKYRVKYSSDDLIATVTATTTETATTDNMRETGHARDMMVGGNGEGNAEEQEEEDEIPDEDDLREADRLASLLSMNFDDDDDERDRDGSHGKISLDAMLSDLTNKLSYYETSDESNTQRFASPFLCSPFPSFSLTALPSQEDSNLLPLTNEQILPSPDSPPNTSHKNLYKGLAEQIYFAELDAEDYFQSLTSYQLHPQDILFTSSSSQSTHISSSHRLQEYELTSELIVPPNKIIGQFERVSEP
jgi:hypothetical protein